MKFGFEFVVSMMLGSTWINFFLAPDDKKAINDGTFREILGSSKFGPGCRWVRMLWFYTFITLENVVMVTTWYYHERQSEVQWKIGTGFAR